MKAHSTLETQPRATVELGFPLLPCTDSDSDVAGLVAALLDEIARTYPHASHGDILQALAITTAVRSALADTEREVGAGMSLALLAFEVDSHPDTAPFDA